jgi:hypothetical protein
MIEAQARGRSIISFVCHRTETSWLGFEIKQVYVSNVSDTYTEIDEEPLVQ